MNNNTSNAYDNNNMSENTVLSTNDANDTFSENDNIRESIIINAPKRGREPSQRSFLLENVMKTPRLSNNDSPFKLLNLVDKRFENLQELLKTMFQESELRLEKMFESKINDLKRDMQSITQRVTKLEAVADDVATLRGEVENLKSQLQRQENTLVSADLRIVGIPYHKEENLFDVFNAVCDTLQINTPMVKSIFRMDNKQKVNANTPDGVIIAKLYSAYEKNFILKSVANFRKNTKGNLLLNYIGYGSDTPFYINENLTPFNHKIFRSAMELKKNNKISASFTMRGLVYIKVYEKDKPIRINSIEHLNDLFRNEEHISM